MRRGRARHDDRRRLHAHRSRAAGPGRGRARSTPARTAAADRQLGDRCRYADRGLATTEELDGLRHELAAEGLEVRVTQVSEAPSVAEALLEQAKKIDADLLVIGLRRRSRTGKFLLGSTAQTVLLRAPCDVMAVRLPAHN